MLDKLVVKVLVFRMRLEDERGQDIMEYAILTGGIAVALVTGLLLFTNRISLAGGFFDRLGNKLNSLAP
jgi:Flp pilus assembly pilin Flp